MKLSQLPVGDATCSAVSIGSRQFRRSGSSLTACIDKDIAHLRNSNAPIVKPAEPGAAVPPIDAVVLPDEGKRRAITARRAPAGVSQSFSFLKVSEATPRKTFAGGVCFMCWCVACAPPPPGLVAIKVSRLESLSVQPVL
jgi:hypothetical protein